MFWYTCDSEEDTVPLDPARKAGNTVDGAKRDHQRSVEKTKPKCVCGSVAVYGEDATHSHWCDLA